jgi:peptidyl-prolyl cis-trans isomerase C
MFLKKSQPNSYVSVYLLLILTASPFLGTSTAHSQTPPSTQPFVTVNGQVLTTAQAELVLREQIQRGVSNTPQLQSAVRGLLVNQTLMAQAAEKAGLDKLPLVQAQIELARANALAQVWQESIAQNAKLTDADLNAEYDRQVAVLGPNEFLIRHLLVAEEATAKLLIDRINSGSTMASLAKEFSRDERTKNEGGLNAWTPQGEVIPAIKDAVISMQKGQLVSKPIRGPIGWHVIQLEDRRAFRPPSFEQVRPQLTQAIMQRLIQTELDNLRQTANVR